MKRRFDSMKKEVMTIGKTLGGVALVFCAVAVVNVQANHMTATSKDEVVETPVITVTPHETEVAEIKKTETPKQTVTPTEAVKTETPVVSTETPKVEKTKKPVKTVAPTKKPKKTAAPTKEPVKTEEPQEWGGDETYPGDEYFPNNGNPVPEPENLEDRIPGWTYIDEDGMEYEYDPTEEEEDTAFYTDKSQEELDKEFEDAWVVYPEPENPKDRIEGRRYEDEEGFVYEYSKELDEE